MKNLIRFLTIAMLFSGCTAHMMETHGEALQVFKSPNNPPGKGGVIRYLNTGLSAMKRARRADAEKKITNFCGGAYAIKEEGPRSKFGSAMPIGKSVSFEVDEYWYVRFDCSSKD